MEIKSYSKYKLNEANNMRDGHIHSTYRATALSYSASIAAIWMARFSTSLPKWRVKKTVIGCNSFFYNI